MPIPSAEERTSALRFADRVAALADEAPSEELRRVTHKLAHRIRKYNGWTQRQKKLAIVKIVADRGGVTVYDLLRMLPWPKQKVYVCINELKEEGSIYIKRVTPPGGSNRGRPVQTLFAAVTPKI